jgi:hypothetical protein
MLDLEATQNEYELMMSNIEEAARATDEYKKKLEAALKVLQAMSKIKLPPATGAGAGAANTFKGTRPGPDSLGPGKEGDVYGNYAFTGGQWVRKSGGGKIMSYMSDGGSPLGSDTVPAMLTPGEYVMKRQAVNKFGTKMFDQLNNGSMPDFSRQLGRYKFNTLNSPTYERMSGGMSLELPSETGTSTIMSSNPVYNSYNVNVDVTSDANPNEIARVVMKQIKSMDSQKIRSNRF